jgi:hypothetical protein
MISPQEFDMQAFFTAVDARRLGEGLTRAALAAAARKQVSSDLSRGASRNGDGCMDAGSSPAPRELRAKHLKSLEAESENPPKQVSSL